MLKQLAVGLVWVGIVITSACPAQEAKPAEDATEGKPETASPLAAAEAEFRELICNRAANFSDASQNQAISIARERRFVDARFNEPIRKVLGSAAKPDSWEIRPLFAAESLIELCTLPTKERLELVFRCYLQCGTSRSDANLRNRFLTRLADYPDETSRLTKERLSQGDQSPHLMNLVSIVGKSSPASLPLVLEAARSDDPEVAEAAMAAANSLLEILKHNERRSQSANAIDRLEAKYVKYAERIVERYDANGDDELTEEEFKTMLMSPLPADSDKNGRITVTEYAAWMQERTKKE